MIDPTMLNHALIETIKANGSLQDPAVEAAFRAVQRHHFLPEVDLERAYQDDAIGTRYAGEQPISSSSQPSIMAIMLEQLGLLPGQRVLEIGAGTGYNAALMAHLVGPGGHVTALDIDQDIIDDAGRHLAAAGVAGVELVTADGVQGWPPRAPYDRIILTASAHDIAPAWLAQLVPDGRLVLPLKIGGGWQASVALVGMGDHWESISAAACGFMPLRGSSAGGDPWRLLHVRPGLSLLRRAGYDTDLEHFFGLLNGPHTAHDLPFSAPSYGALDFWLGLYESDFCVVSAESVWAGRVPRLWGQRGTLHIAPGIYDGVGLALLLKAPSSTGQDTAGLRVWAYGAAESLVKRLARQVAAWEAKGSPGIAALWLRVYPAGYALPPQPGVWVISRPWSTLVIGWR